MARHSLLRSFALAVLLFGAVWVAVIAYWRMNNHVPSGADAALYLIALPLILLGTFVLIRLGIKAGKRGGQETDEGAAHPDSDADQESAPSAHTLSVLAVHALFASGGSPAELAEATKDVPPPTPHPVLRDSQGMPIFAAEIEGIDTEAVDTSLPDTAQGWNPSYKRTLWLTETLALRLLEAHFEALRDASPSSQAQTPLLQVEWLPPMRWNNAERKVAHDWLADRLAAHGWASPQLQLETRSCEANACIWQRLNELNHACNTNLTAPPHLLMASDSFLDETLCTSWETQNRLYNARCPEGVLPGEGAAAVMLAAPGTHGLTELARLSEVFVAERGQAVDMPQRLQADTLRDLIKQTLTAYGLDDDAPARLVSDTDLRASRNGEALYLAEQVLPERDPIDALLALGVGNGECGTSLALALVAVAAHLTGDSQQPHMVVSHADTLMRAVCAVIPAAAETATPSPSLA
jgi:hypothetical protein